VCSTCWLDELKYVFNYGVLRRHPKVRLILVVVVVIIIIFIYLIYLLCCNFWEDLSCIRLKFIAFVSSLMVLYKCGCASAVCVQQACSRDIIYSPCPDVPMSHDNVSPTWLAHVLMSVPYQLTITRLQPHLYYTTGKSISGWASTFWRASPLNCRGIWLTCTV